MRLQAEPERRSAAAIRSGYVEARRRLWTSPLPARPVAPPPPPPPMPAPSPSELVPAARDHARAMDISRTIAARYGIAYALLLGPQRRRFNALVRARWEIMWTLKREFPDWSLPRIGRFLKMDHTSVLHGIRQHERKRAAVEGVTDADALGRQIAQSFALPFAALFLCQTSLHYRQRTAVARARGKLIRTLSREREWSNHRISVYLGCNIGVIGRTLRHCHPKADKATERRT